jgi:hypothetical protein
VPPAGSVLINNEPPTPFPSTLLGGSSTTRTFTIRNTRIETLGGIAVTKGGASTNDFTLTPPATNSLNPGENVTFSVAFLPTAGGDRTTQISIASNDTNNSPFIINLSGFGLSEDFDSDADGLNDAAEFTMSPLGFDWQAPQPAMVNVLFSNANRADLYDSTQYEANRITGVAEGKAEVTNNPGAFNLYTSNSIMDLRMGGLMIQRQGSNATVTFQPQTTTDLATQPFTNNGAPITNEIPMPGDKGFMRFQVTPGLPQP